MVSSFVPHAPLRIGHDWRRFDCVLPGKDVEPPPGDDTQPGRCYTRQLSVEWAPRRRNHHDDTGWPSLPRGAWSRPAPGRETGPVPQTPRRSSGKLDPEVSWLGISKDSQRGARPSGCVSRWNRQRGATLLASRGPRTAPRQALHTCRPAVELRLVGGHVVIRSSSSTDENRQNGLIAGCNQRAIYFVTSSSGALTTIDPERRLAKPDGNLGLLASFHHHTRRNDNSNRCALQRLRLAAIIAFPCSSSGCRSSPCRCASPRLLWYAALLLLFPSHGVCQPRPPTARAAYPGAAPRRRRHVHCPASGTARLSSYGPGGGGGGAACGGIGRPCPASGGLLLPNTE